MEIMVVGVLALIVFGPDKLPEIARTLGGFMKQLRAMADDVKQEFSEFEVGDEPDDDEVAALAENDSEVARLDEKKDESSDSPADADHVDSEPGPVTDGHSDHPVAGAIKAEREKSTRIEGA
jgi:Tat protein translocase TatB subunit